MNTIHYVDGFTVGRNPSRQGGCTITDRDGNIVKQYFVKSLQDTEITNNYTEFLSLYLCLEIANHGDIIYTDSMNSIAWSSGKFQKKSKRKDLIPLAKEINRLLSVKNITLTWVSRNSNLAGLVNEKCEYAGWENYNLETIYSDNYTFDTQLSLFV